MKTIYILYVSLWEHVFKMAPLSVAWIPSWSLWWTKSWRSGQAYHLVLPRKANYSCQVSRVCVASVKVELRALVTDSTFERYACGFRAAHLVSPLSCSSHCSSLKICCRQRQQSSKDRSLFRSYSGSIVMHGSESIVIFAKGLLTTHLTPPNTS